MLASALSEQAAGLRFGSGEAEFPTHPPSAAPLLFAPTEFVFCKAKCAAKEKGVALAPTHPCAGNGNELPRLLILKFLGIVA